MGKQSGVFVFFNSISAQLILLVSMAVLFSSGCNPLKDGFSFSTAKINTSVVAIPISPTSGGGNPIPLATATPNFSDDSGEQAQLADQFVDSIGTTTHFNYTGTFYGTQFTRIRQLLIDSGIRHIRDGGPNQSADYYNIINSLYTEAGIRNIGGLGTGDQTTLPGLVESFITSMPHAEGIESLNEYDASGVASWASYLMSYQPKLYAAVKANSKTAGLPVIGPSMAQTGNLSQLGNLSAYLDAGNLHNYYTGHNPGSGGWGDNGYGSIAYCLNQIAPVAGNKPVWTTETGYYTGSAAFGQSPDDVNGRYVPRLLLEQFNAGFARTYLYQFAAEGVDASTSDGSSAYGLVDGLQQPKPQYLMVKNLISILSDKGASFAPGKLDYTLSSNAGSSLHHSLFQKHDGSFYLVLWLEAESWNALNQTYETVMPQNVSVSFSKSPSTIVQSSFSNLGVVTQSNPTLTGRALSFSLSDRVTILQVTR